LCPRPYGSESGHYPFLPGAFKPEVMMRYYKYIIGDQILFFFFNSDFAEKEKPFWGDMLMKIKKKIIYTRRRPGEDEYTLIFNNYLCPALIFEAF